MKERISLFFKKEWKEKGKKEKSVLQRAGI
jgi:hypothetical protein